VEHFCTEILGGASGAGAYGLVLGILLLCGLGFPMPEDVVLITGGFLVFKGAAHLNVMLLVAFAGILAGDSIAFYLGRHLGEGLQRRWPFRVLITPAKWARVEGLFARYGQKLVLAARFMPGVRAVTFFVAGHARMRYLSFICYDGLAALVSAPLFVLLGYEFGENIDTVIKGVRHGQWAVISVVVCVAGAWLLFRYWRQRRQRMAETLESPTSIAAPVPGIEGGTAAAPASVPSPRNNHVESARG